MTLNGTGAFQVAPEEECRRMSVSAGSVTDVEPEVEDGRGKKKNGGFWVIYGWLGLGGETKTKREKVYIYYTEVKRIFVAAEVHL